MSKGIFGNLFDLNGDGDLDLFEQAAELFFLHKMMEGDDEKDDSDNSDRCIALHFSHGSADDDWRDRYYGGESGIDPDDFDTEEEYLEAVEEKERWISAIPDNISELAQGYFIDPEDYDSYEEFLDAVKDEL